MTDSERLAGLRAELQDLLTTYRDLCAQKKDVDDTQAQLRERGTKIDNDIARMQGAIGYVHQKVNELEKTAGMVQPEGVQAEIVA